MEDNCAFNTYTGLYDHPKLASKYVKYTCPDKDCGQPVFLCYGEKYKPHFRHYCKSNCVRYKTCLNESEKHMEGKRLLASLICKGYNIIFENKCNGTMKATCKVKKHETCLRKEEDCCIEEEYGMEYKGSFIKFDLVNKNNVIDEINEGYEIYVSHRTLEESRPSYIKWYEISADEIINKIKEIGEDKKIILKNRRVWQCKDCALWDKKEEKRIRMLKQSELKKICLKKRRQDLIKNNFELLRELKKDIQELKNTYNGTISAYFLNYETFPLQLNIDTTPKMPEDVYINLVNKHFKKYKYIGDKK